MDRKMDAPTIIRAFNLSWAIALSPLSQKKKILLTSSEQREVERTSRQAGEKVGME